MRHAPVRQTVSAAQVKGSVLRALPTREADVGHHWRFSPRQAQRGRALAQAIVDTVRVPLLVLDQDLRVLAANRSFYLTFQASPQDTIAQLFFALGDGQWDIPELRVLLEKVASDRLEGYEVEHEFAGLGRRIIKLNA